ncbi:3-methyladenine DNA glycosylase [Cellulomonas fengjieae]|uniref:3-methyladenine DNA glycosylase n=1 Tax=Cellulomonas fengjieae TaxID=2819978 RepID=A0ABS3SGC7_9CELL|nr:3-methyladenine DNA glycosylase [Cellulomonas fengjieae]MBO3084808.1 3-methyladenine DNA glycosylase [Cellulomonas fengjieae]QVI66875.1 3-methyladenine DNA glycosylase [Cellulomonas fengjieae]
MPVTVPVLDATTWQSLADAHADRADAFTAGRRERRSRQQKHAIEDFLFEYYPVTPAALRRWHPGVGVALEVPAPHADWRWYRTDDGTVALDVDAFVADRGDAVRFIHGLLTATLGRAPVTGCFGLHEWAMVYRERDEHRHPLPLRLGAAGTDAVVEKHKIRCTHFDAYRFFTPEAVGRNTLRPTRESMTAMEQPGCLHAGMDVYKWATKLGPAVPGELLLDCFELARDIRTLDMQASPYDVTTYGLDPVAIETPEGKAQYVARQRTFAERGNVLRARLVEVCEALLA